MSAQPRTIQAAPSTGQLVAIFATLIAATVLVVALAYGQLAATKSVGTPLAGSAPVTNDHGWSTAAGAAAPVLNDHGWSTSTSSAPISHITAPVRITAFDKAHGAATGRSLPEGGSGGSIRGRLAR